ncbi:FliG C-terminal domain-containing protein [Bdellovibrio bacteriovorus]|uniref:Flagellar motor switch protein FliG n=1 Tax=Bdellovibrio bacteriovorus TaxID=959 RepID=A0A1Z3NC45_BDEBC|nr:FliG C-terminal domain-containing protein [Bdellovibrio bacteriovorus]ASD65026.1 hypothetical protein B9G79_16350 [Bdellovibrio bacteriovorus]
MKTFLTLLFLLVGPLGAQAQYIEEIGTLETIYETRARSVLNTILRPTDYTLVVSVELDRDDKKLKEYQDEVEAQYLPGMPLMGEAPAMPKSANRLHEMKARTDIHVVLSRNVNPDVEKVIKDLLVSKLHLDMQSGDTVALKRIELPADPTVEKKPTELPELTWKMWALIVVVSLLALSGLMFWAWRRGQSKENPKDLKEIHEYAHGPEDKKDESGETKEVVAAGSEPNAGEMEVEMDLLSIKQHVISIATQYPQLSSKSISDFVLKGHSHEVTLFMEFLGWDTSKKIYTDIPAVAWARIGQAIKNKKADPTKSEMETAVRDVYKVILADYIQHQMENEDENPFMFVLKMKPEERNHLLEKESASNVAVLCLNAPPEVTSDIISSLGGEKKSRVLSELTRIEKLPQDVIKSVEASFKARIAEMKASPELRVEGASVLARVVRGMSPEEEMDILKLFEEENPEEFDRIRRVIMVFSDLKILGTELLSELFDSYDTDVIYAALYRSKADVQSAVLAALPQKKAMLVERDLQDGVVVPQKSITSRTRREVCIKAEEVLMSRSVRLSDLVDGNVVMGKTA